MDLSRRMFLNLAGATALGTAALTISGCGESRQQAQSSAAAASSASPTARSDASADSNAAASSAAPSNAAASSNTLVIFYSRAGENYEVGYIEEGNTSIVAKMIAEATNADLFEVAPVEAYPESYDECCDVALAEQNAGARPAFAEDVDLAPYKTIYLGYPIWWNDLPMCLYTFLESHEWEGKDIHPFCTHGGSGLVDTVESIQGVCTGANVGKGLSISGTVAQNSRDQALAAVKAWLG